MPEVLTTIFLRFLTVYFRQYWESVYSEEEEDYGNLSYLHAPDEHEYVVPDAVLHEYAEEEDGWKKEEEELGFYSPHSHNQYSSPGRIY